MPKKKSTITRFTSGDYYGPPSAGRSLYYFGEAPRFAWVRVLEAMEEIAPSVVESLARQVFPAYQRAARIPTAFPLNDPETLSALTLQPDCPMELHTLKKVLSRWAARWNLNEPGLHFRALETMSHWLHHPAKKRKREWVIQGPRVPCSFPHVAHLHFVAHGWHPQTEPRQEAERRILTELQRQVKDCLDRAETVVKDQYGLVKSPIKTQVEHFGWFVRYQVLGESLTVIATAAQTDPPTVHRAIESVGCLLSGLHWPAWKRPRGKSGPRPTRS